MKKLMLLAAMLALVVVAASPVFAQSGSEIEVEEGDVTITDSTTVEGSILQNCPASVTFGDGNVNVQTVSGSQNIGSQNAADAQYGNPTGIVITGDENEVEIEQALEQAGFSPEVATECAQEIAQAAAAGAGTAEAKAGAAKAKAEASKAEAKAGGAEAKAGGGAEAKAGGGAEAKAGGGAKAEAPKTLPATGGGAGLIALGAGALLVAGGLVARRIIK